MSDNVRNFIVGIVTIIALTGLGGLLMMLGELDSLLRTRYAVTMNTNIAAGLRVGSPVELNGVPVGSVSEISLTLEKPEYPVRVVMMIDDRFDIPMDIVPRVEQSLIGGTTILQLRTPQRDAGTPFTVMAKDGKASLTAFQRTLIEQIMAELDARTQGLTDSLASFNRLTETYIALGENLNDLVRRQDGDAIAQGETPNLHAAVARLNVVLERAASVVTRADEWLADEELRLSLHETLAGARRMIDTAAATFEQFTSTAVKLEADAGDMMLRLVPVADELAATLEEVRRLTRLASEGRGTVAQLLNNPDLYNALTDAAIRLERALIEAQLLMQKINAEGLPLRF